MKIKCDNCLPKNGIDIPEFNLSEKIKISELISYSAMQAIFYIHQKFSMNLQDAKYVILHINTTYGHCHHCTFDKLKGENSTCPICNTFNFNWRNNTLP